MTGIAVTRMAALAVLLSGGTALGLAGTVPLEPELGATDLPLRHEGMGSAERLQDQERLDAVERHPFRPDRRAPPLPYAIAVPPPPPPEPREAPPRPVLRLAGHLWGASPRIVLEGVPGHEAGLVLVQGDTVAGLRVGRVLADRVIIVGFDTTWVLRPRGNW